MRIDLTQTGSKDIDIEFNGQPMDGVLWADDETGECEVFEKHWMSGELVKDPSTTWGYRSLLLKGKVKINDRRPKQIDQNILDFHYHDVCCLIVQPARFSADASTILVQDWASGAMLHTFFFNGLTSKELVENVVALNRRLTVQLIRCDQTGIGAAVYSMLQQFVTCPLYPC